MKTVTDPVGLSSARLLKILSGSVVPRPIAWTSTVAPAGTYNLAPFSFFTVASISPPMLAIVITPPEADEGRPTKDTLANVLAAREFVVNLVSEELGYALAESAAPHHPDVDEFAVAGVTPVSATCVQAPMVGEATINMECRLHHVVRVGDGHIIIGQLVCYHIERDLCLPDGRVDIAELKPLARLPGAYTSVDRIFHLPTPTQPTVGQRERER